MSSVSSRQIIILAGGKGKRMGADLPEVIVPLHDQPVIKHLLTEVKKIEQNTNPVIVVGFKQELVRKALGEGCLYAEQAEQKGTGHAVLMSKPYVTADNLIVLYGDMPFTTSESILKLIQLHESSQAKVSMFTAHLPNFNDMYKNFWSYGRIIRDDNGRIIKIKELVDCSEQEQQITEVNPGIYMFNSEWLWPHLEKIGNHNAQGEIYLTDIIEIAINDHQEIQSTLISAKEIFGINTPEQLAYAEQLI